MKLPEKLLKLPNNLNEYSSLFMNKKSYRSAAIALRKMNSINGFIRKGYVLIDEYNDVLDGEFMLIVEDAGISIGFVNKPDGNNLYIYLIVGDVTEEKTGLIYCDRGILNDLSKMKLLTPINVGDL